MLKRCIVWTVLLFSLSLSAQVYDRMYSRVRVYDKNNVEKVDSQVTTRVQIDLKEGIVNFVVNGSKLKYIIFDVKNFSETLIGVKGLYLDKNDKKVYLKMLIEKKTVSVFEENEIIIFYNNEIFKQRV